MRDGKSVTSISLSEQPLATGTIPSAVERVGKEFVYVSSATGPGLLLRWSSSAHALSRQANGQADTQTSKEQEEREVAGGMDNEDEDLYGSSVPQTNGEVHRALDVTADNLVLAHQDTLDSYGPIRSLTVGIVSEDTQPELVAATGGMTSGSLTVFHVGQWLFWINSN